jgi:hypothetical protein
MQDKEFDFKLPNTAPANPMSLKLSGTKFL